MGVSTVRQHIKKGEFFKLVKQDRSTGTVTVVTKGFFVCCFLFLGLFCCFVFLGTSLSYILSFLSGFLAFMAGSYTHAPSSP